MRIVGFSAIFVVIYSFAVCDGANILFLAGMPSPSHGIWNFRLIEALAKRGHNITVLTVDLPKKPIKNVHVLHMKDTYELLYSGDDIDLEVFMDLGLFDEAKYMFGFMLKACESCGKTKGFRQLLNYPNDFKVDLVINDFSISSCLLGFLHKFNYPPLISVTAFKYATSFAERVGGHQFTGYIPRPRFPFTTNMTLYQRVLNTVATIHERIYRRFIFQRKYDKIIGDIFQQDDIPSSFELDKKTTIVLLNTHPSTDFPFPLPPNVIEVGGLQIADPQPLPVELENFVRSAKKGAILIAFGTNVNSDLFQDAHQQIVINVVKKFPDYHFLWKFEKDPTDGKVPNLMVKTWLPQNDILAHPSTKAFISHAGGLSTQESTWHGVPVVAVPFYFDQIPNAHAAVLAGVATLVDVQKLKATDFEAAIRTILEDPSYKERIMLRSDRFRSRPMKPLDTAIWWIEYVLKDPNPNHLQSPVVLLGEFVACSYDLILYGVLILAVVFYEILFFKRLLFKWVKGSSANVKQKLN